MSPTKKHQKQGKSLFRTISKTNNAKDDKQQQKINEKQKVKLHSNARSNSTKRNFSIQMVFIEESNLKHFLKTNEMNQKQMKM